MQLSWLDYDAETTSDRYWAVNTLFDLLLTEVLVERRNFWRRFYELEQQIEHNDIRLLRNLLTTISISEEEAISATSSINEHGRSIAGAGILDTSVIMDWRERNKQLMSQIDVTLRELEQKAPQ